MKKKNWMWRLTWWIPRPMLQIEYPGGAKCVDPDMIIAGDDDEEIVTIRWISPRKFSQLPEFDGP